MSTLATLRACIAALEGWSAQAAENAVPFGVPSLDQAMPGGGLGRRALHEIEGGDGAAAGFGLALGRRLAGNAAALLWCSARLGEAERGEIYGPGLGFFGLAPERLILVQARNPRDVLWTLEEGMRSRGIAAVIGEVEDTPMIASRRLQLAAETHGVTALLLTPPRRSRPPSVAVTRWRVAAAPCGDGLAVRPGVWRLDLLRCRCASGDSFGPWLVEWNDETCGFDLAAPARDRSRMQAPSRSARTAVGDGRGEEWPRLRRSG